jgi:hypothetical protein
MQLSVTWHASTIYMATMIVKLSCTFAKILDFALSQYWYNSCYPLLIHRSPAIGRSIDMVAELVRDLQLAIRQSGNVNKFLGLLNRQLEKFPGGMLCFASCSRNFPH